MKEESGDNEDQHSRAKPGFGRTFKSAGGIGRRGRGVGAGLPDGAGPLCYLSAVNYRSRPGRLVPSEIAAWADRVQVEASLGRLEASGNGTIAEASRATAAPVQPKP